jgi:hypothetical protein
MTLVTHRRLVATLAEAFIATLAAAGSVAVTTDHQRHRRARRSPG